MQKQKKARRRRKKKTIAKSEDVAQNEVKEINPDL